MSPTNPLMQLREVTCQVAGATLLEPLSLALPACGITGLIGQNGSGKSTLLRILARQQLPTAGEALFEDKPLAAPGEREFARRVGYLPQDLPLASGLTACELIELGRYPWHGALGRFGPEDRLKVDDAIAMTGTAAFRDRMVEALSGGERQRVWLAMLLAQDPQLLLLDEPISALDPAHQLRVLELIRRISRERGIAIVMVLHDVNLAVRFCDHLIALQRGRLIAQGEPASFMEPARLRAIYEVDMGVISNPDLGQPMAYVRGPGESQRGSGPGA